MNITVFIKKRQLTNWLKSIFSYLKKAAFSFLKLTFSKRQILFVTNEKIRTVSLGPIAQFAIFLSISWVFNLFYQSIQYNKVISAKSEEIARLKNVTTYYDTEFSNINNRLVKVNDYLVTVTGKNVLQEKTESNFDLPHNLGEKNLTKDDMQTVKKIEEASVKIFDIRNKTSARIRKIEKTISKAGLNIKRPKNNIANLIKKYPELENLQAQGGPLVSLENYSASQVEIQNFSYDKLLDTARFVDDIDRLMLLEKLTIHIPLTRPIKNYFVSSGFGPRVDPITKGIAMHQGLDFVGPKNEEIFSPSKGKVILAGKFYDYGNAVVIDHGFGITTRYGHLSKVLVKKGQEVTKGDLIALQGSTGRSTGQHLHYEVRYKNSTLDPKKFIKAGDAFFASEARRKPKKS